MDIITNPVVVSITVMTVLCLLKFNIVIAIMISAVLGGLIAGMPMNVIMPTFIGGMAAKNQVVLSYLLLGALAYGISGTGLAGKFAKSLEKTFGKTGKWFVLILAGVACLSQNVIPIHIAFIPILIPPMIHLFNKMKIDRRGVACALVFGLKAPYMLIPMGFGIIFHGIVATNMNLAGMEIDAADMVVPAILPTIGMVIGLFIAIFITYRKPREYKDLPLSGMPEVAEDTGGFELKHWGALIGALTAFATQLIFRAITGTAAMWALPLGAAIGILIMVATGAIKYKEFDANIKGGIGLMGFIAFIMLAAGGFAGVMHATAGVAPLVDWARGIVGDNRLGAVLAMQMVGLFITMGIGTSFGTIPIIAIVFVPFMMEMGFSPAATAALIIAAGVTGDAGTPASDSTLGPTAGLSVDGQHDHIYDTCVPSFIHFNFPIMIMGTIAAMIL
ncbi:MAG: TRAP transporter large permease subunit [Spirochaetes bacterium]|nr:TRAP transporter large permease subunit [Spirochaetota bacterium]